MRNDELYHHGVKGQKWGERRYQNKDGSYTAAGKARRAENYSDEQRRRDERVYSKGAVKRINKAMLEGDSISGARSSEATRIANYREAAQAGRNIGSIAGAVGGLVGGMAAVKALQGTKYAYIANNPTAQLAITGGISAIGVQLGKYAGQASVMAVGGYSPGKYR